MAHTLTFSGVTVTVDGAAVTSPYTLTNSCTIVAELTADKPIPTTPPPELIVNGEQYALDTTIDISNSDITIKGYKGDTGVVVTINYTEISTPRLSVDVSTLAGWANLSAGEKSITIVAKAAGYKDSAPSAAVQVTKAAAMPAKGDIITLDSKQYRVLKTEGTVAEVLAMYDAAEQYYGGTSQTYANSNVNAYCDSAFYNSLSANMKNAIVQKAFQQDSWEFGEKNSAIAKYVGTNSSSTKYILSLMSTSFDTSISRKCYVLSCQDIIDYLDVKATMTEDDTTLTAENIWKMFWNQTTSKQSYPWTRSARADLSDQMIVVNGDYGNFGNGSITSSYLVRPAFQIDLSKISWS